MKKSLKWIMLFGIALIIVLFKSNSVYAASVELTVNPVYENIFSEEQKEKTLQQLDDNLNKEKKYKAYNSTTYTNYNELVKVIQNNLLKRKTSFMISYKTKSSGFDPMSPIQDAMSEKYATSQELGDYMRWSVYGYGHRSTYYQSSSYTVYNMTFSTTYFTTYEQEQQLTKAINNYVKTYNSKLKSKYEIIFDFNHYICENVDYYNSGNLMDHSAYAAMVNHKAVCQGYATLYYRLLKACGVNNRIVVSDEINHAWNAVEYNGLWYMVDTTWNDTYYANYPNYPLCPYHDFFMKSVKDFKEHGSLTDAKPAISELNYTTTSVDMEANRFNISGASGESITLYEEIVNGNKSPNLDLFYTGTKLVKGKDYNITNVEVIDSEKAVVTIQGIHKFKGTKQIIVKKKINLSGYAVSTIANQIYSGKAIIPNVIVSNGNITLKNGVDYIVTCNNNVNVGTATLVITGKGDYTGTITRRFTISKLSISKITIAAIANQTYTDKDIKPNITAKNGNVILKKGIDYDISYKNNKYPGTATMTITGKGNYMGVVTKTFKIEVGKVKSVAAKKNDINSITIKWNRDKAVTGYEIYMSTKKNSGYKKIATIKKNSTTSYKKTKLKDGKTYYFKVKAYLQQDKKTKKYGAYSSILTTTTKTKTPSITKMTAGRKKATAKWKKVTGATGYEVYMSTKKSSGYKKIGTTTKNSKVTYTKTKLKSRKTYYFKIRTYRTVNGKKVYSSYSKVKSVKVK